MAGYDACEARNQCTENESDAYQHHLGCASHDRRRNAGMRIQLNIRCAQVKIREKPDFQTFYVKI